MTETAELLARWATIGVVVAMAVTAGLTLISVGVWIGYGWGRQERWVEDYYHPARVIARVDERFKAIGRPDPDVAEFAEAAPVRPLYPEHVVGRHHRAEDVAA